MHLSEDPELGPHLLYKGILYSFLESVGPRSENLPLVFGLKAQLTLILKEV